MGLNDEFRDGKRFEAWGPLISPAYENEAITNSDIIVASVVWALTVVFAVTAVVQMIKQTKSSRSPLRSTYVWMIWLELVCCFVMGLECFLHLLKLIPPSEL